MPAKKQNSPARELAAFLKESGQTARDFAGDVDCSEGRLSQILADDGSQVSPKLAINIHRKTRGRVPGSMWRPDLWARPEDVPVGKAAQ